MVDPKRRKLLDRKHPTANEKVRLGKLRLQSGITHRTLILIVLPYGIIQSILTLFCSGADIKETGSVLLDFLKEHF